MPVLLLALLETDSDFCAYEWVLVASWAVGEPAIQNAFKSKRKLLII